MIDPLQNYFCHKVVLDAQIMISFYLKKKCFVLEISRFSRFLWNPQISTYVTLSWAWLHNGSYTYAYFFWILRTIKMRFSKMLVSCTTNVYNKFFWRFILNSWLLSFLILLYSPFRKNETLEYWDNWLLHDRSKLLNWKGYSSWRHKFAKSWSG